MLYGLVCVPVLKSRDVIPFLEEEEVDKMMEQKMKEEEERKRTKEIEERMSLEETKEQVRMLNLKPCVHVCCNWITELAVNVQVMKMGEKLQGLQEEKHQLFLQLKKVLHEEEKRRRKEQRYSGDHSAPPPWHQLQFLLSFPVILRHWRRRATLPACPCMLASTCSAFKVLFSPIFRPPFSTAANVSRVICSLRQPSEPQPSRRSARRT